MPSSHRITFLISLLTILISFLIACDDSPSEADRAPEGAEKSSTGPGQWEPVAPEELTAHQQAMADYAGTSRGVMGQRLMGTVMEAAEEGGFGSAVEVCAQEAEPIAAEISQRRGVAIGRTSTELRNPDNQPPEWARDHIETGVDDQFYAAADDGTLGTAIPIHLAAPCANCHGEADQLASGVPEALELHYPEDRATGYQKGDLRGWFWVEVPPEIVEIPELEPEADDENEESAASPGEDLYVDYCAACHGRDGEGTPKVFPPLVGTSMVQDDPTALIAVTLDGVSGPLDVDGDEYDGFMPGQAQLSDQEVAELLTYIRTSWGNEAEEVDASMVRTVRDRTMDRTSAWNQDDLDALRREIDDEPWIE